MAYPNMNYTGGPKPPIQGGFQPQPQPFYPLPQGNVYTIDNPNEVDSVPCGTGVSVALCLNKNLMYIKSIQGGSPLFWVYKISPMMETKQDTDLARSENEVSDERVRRLEEKIDMLLKEVNGNAKSELAKLATQ